MLTCILQKKCPIWGYTAFCLFLVNTELIPQALLLFSLVYKTASNLSKCLTKSQKHAFLENPPSKSMLKPLIPNRAASPCPPGNT